MPIKDILHVIDLNSGESPTARYAVELARNQGAHLTGLALAIDPIFPTFVDANVPVEVIASARQSAVQSAESGLARFNGLAQAAGVAHSGRLADVIASGAETSLAQAARVTDLVVIGQYNPDRPEPLREPLIETALFEAGAPMIVVPYISDGAFRCERIMIAWDDSRTAARAVRVAVNLLAFAREVLIVAVGPPRGERDSAADVGVWLSRHGISSRPERRQEGPLAAGDALLSYAADRGVDLLVMGAYGHSRFREYVFGGTTRLMLRSMTLPVLMAH